MNQQERIAKAKRIKELEDWIKQATNELKDHRKEFIAELFGERPADAEGTTKTELAHVNVKLTDKLTRRIIADDETLHELINNLDSEVAKARLVTFKPSLSTAEYRKLSPGDKALIDQILEVKPATPSLVIEGDFS